MLHPVFRLAASQPQLLAEHAAGYAGLLAEEVASSGAHIKRRITLQIIGLLSLMVALILGGVAVLLWASLPPASLQQPWLLWFTPLVPAALGMLAMVVAQNRAAPPAFATLREQFAQDASLLRRTTAP
jgi:DNA-binding transcriptional LysR family regulator